MIFRILLLAQAATAPASTPKLSDVQAQAIIQSSQEMNMAAEILDALRRLDRARQAFNASIADGAKVCGSYPIQPNGVAACAELKK